MTKQKVIYVESDKEKTGWKIWRALGRNNTIRRINAFVVMCVILGAVILALYIAGKYSLIHILWSK